MQSKTQVTTQNHYILLLLSFTLLMMSCQKEPLIVKNYEGVDDKLCTYFQKFEEAGADRNVFIDLAASGIIGSIEKIHADGTVGLCHHRSDTPNQIIIDKDFWSNASENSKEMIVFHELGHCFLGKNHNDERNNDSTCSSIMRSGNGGCIDFYNSRTRAELLDELFEVH